jgi:hypothetical protein
VQRRYGLEKVTLTRSGTARAVSSRQLALLVAAALTTAVVLVVEVVGRAIAYAAVSSGIPFAEYPPLAPPSVQSGLAQNGLEQWGIALLVVAFFGGAGIAIGSIVGVFAVPAIVFLVWDLVVPFLGAGDPRNWFVVLGHGAFDYSSGFQLAPSLPLAVPIALGAPLVGAVVFLALGYGGIRIRNPLAT